MGTGQEKGNLRLGVNSTGICRKLNSGGKHANKIQMEKNLNKHQIKKTCLVTWLHIKTFSIMVLMKSCNI